MVKHDFEGWATRANLRCTDGRIIMADSFKHQDGDKVPLVWGHNHNDPTRVLGHAFLENRSEGVYAYGVFNDSEQGQNAKLLVEHGDIDSLSIFANQLKQNGPYVQHGKIIELSLVLAGANPGAYIQNVIKHSDDGGEPIVYEDQARIYTGEHIILCHSDDNSTEENLELSHADDSFKEDKKVADETKKTDGEKTVKDVIDTFNEEQRRVFYAMIGVAREDVDDSDDTDDSEGGNETMKHNVFDTETKKSNVLSHSDQTEILNLAKANNVGSFQTALQLYAQENESLQHGFVDEEGEDAIESLFPEYKLTKAGAPELLERDLSWVDHVMRGTHKSPISRIRTRQADARGADLRAHGYSGKGAEKVVSGNIKLLNRTTDPQTIYRKDTMHRDDIIDITDFDVVNYQWGIMRRNLEEEIALAVMIGDGREDGDEMKIDENHIRSIWHDDELYTIHADVDIVAAREELQGLNTGANFGENYIYAEAIITAALYSREKYKGSGALEFYCTPHLLNVMLLARDLNGRRIYSSKSDLAAALNVTAIHTVEQFEGKVRTVKGGTEQKKLLGLFVNLKDYQIGSTKGGEITKFDQFDIDFNRYKYLIETRISGALTRVYSAIALEEPVVAG